MEPVAATPRRADWRLAAALLSALALAFAAQKLLLDETFTRRNWAGTVSNPSRLAAGAVLLLGAVAVAWAGARRSPLADPSIEEPSDALPAPARRTLVRALVAGGVPWAASLAVLSRGDENTLVRALWVASVVGFLVVLAGDRAAQGPAAVPRRPTWEVTFVVLVTLAAFGLRAWRLPEIPASVHDDVFLLGWRAVEFLQDRVDDWTGMSTVGHSRLKIQVLALSIQIFGPTLSALLIPQVVAGTLTIPLVYLFVRDVFGRRTAAFSILLLAGAYTHVHFSRTMFGPVATAFACLFFVLLGRALRSGSPLAFGAAGGVLGLGIFEYYSFRVVPVVLAVLLLGSTRRRARAGSWGLLAFGAVLALGPMLVSVLKDTSRFVGRGNVVAIWNPDSMRHSKAKYATESVAGVLEQQAVRTFLTLHKTGDESPHFRFDRPMVGAPEAALFLVGLGLALARSRSWPNQTLLSWFALTFLLGGVATLDPPYWPHLNIALVPILVLAARAADRVVEAVGGSRPRVGAALTAVVAAVLVLGLAHGFRVYWKYVGDLVAQRPLAARFVLTRPATLPVLLVSDDIREDMATFRYLWAGRSWTSRTNREFVESPPTGPRLVLVFEPQRLPEADRARLLPASAQEHRDGHGTFRFLSYEIADPCP